MDNSVNTASWRYKMGLPRPQCCDNFGAFGENGTTFFAFRNYIKKHNLDRNRVLGHLAEYNVNTLPYWVVIARNRKI